MAFAFTVKLPNGEAVKGNIGTNSSRVALSRLAKDMTEQLSPEELDGFVELKLRMIGANDSFRRIAAPTAEANGASEGSEGNAGVAARQAATRGEKGKGARK